MKKQVHVSANKTEAYIATVLLFNQVKIMSQSKVGGWKLAETYTSMTDKHFITEYSNGKMQIRAESVNGVHTYTIKEESKRTHCKDCGLELNSSGICPDINCIPF